MANGLLSPVLWGVFVMFVARTLAITSISTVLSRGDCRIMPLKQGVPALTTLVEVDGVLDS